MADERVVVVFLVNSAPYNAGEVAGFPRDRAEILIRRGIAKPVAKPEKKAVEEIKPAAASRQPVVRPREVAPWQPKIRIKKNKGK